MRKRNSTHQLALSLIEIAAEDTCAQAARVSASLVFRINNVERRRADLARRLVAPEAEGHPRICFGSRKLFNAQHHLAQNGFTGPDEDACPRRVAQSLAREARRAVSRAWLQGRRPAVARVA